MRNVLVPIFLLLTCLTVYAGQLPLAPPQTEASARLAKSYGQLPLSFERNQGQSDKSVKFISRGQGYTLFLTPTEAVLALRKAEPKSGGKEGPAQAAKQPENRDSSSREKPSPKGEGWVRGNINKENSPIKSPHPSLLPLGEGAKSKATTETLALHMQLVGANPNPTVEGLDELPGKINYLKGNDPKQWRTGVGTYGKVKLSGVYDGVDLVYYGNGQQLEYDFIVSPGADPKAIRLNFSGADNARIDAKGDLLLHTPDGELRLQKPVVYQTVGGRRQNVDGRFVLHDVPLKKRQGKGKSQQIGFLVAAYDAAQSLVIDPVLVYSTFLGGSSLDTSHNIAVDSAGNAYVTGSTYSSDFPKVNAKYPVFWGFTDAFIVKFSADGSKVLYSTYLGGSNMDEGYDIAVDSTGNAYVTGFTTSSNFPTVNAKYPALWGSSDAFVVKFSADGSTVKYSTYLGGSSSDNGISIAVNSAGDAYVTGSTQSTDFPKMNAKYPTLWGYSDAFVVKFSSNGSTVKYSTYLGGSSFDSGEGIAVDSAGNAYVTGSTQSTDFPKVNAKYPALWGSKDAFVFKLSDDGQTVHYSIYLGGSSEEEGRDIAVNSDGNAYITGYTKSSDFPKVNAKYPTLWGDSDAFIVKFSADGSTVKYSTYLGGSSSDNGMSIAVDSAGDAYVTGSTQSTDFPKVNAKYLTLWGNSDAFVVKFSSNGSTVKYSTYLGGSGSESGYGIAVDSVGNAYVTGQTGSYDFPTVNAKYPNLWATDAFVTKINLAVTNTPEQPVYSPPTTSVEVPPEKSKNIVYLIHGWNSAPSVWADGMRKSIVSQLISQNNVTLPVKSDAMCDTVKMAYAVWLVCVKDWSGEAKTGLTNPWGAYVNALDVGKHLGQDLVIDNYNLIHFIARSAGSQVADTAARWIDTLAQTQGLIKPQIHTTFLDAFDPAGDSSLYGSNSDWAEQYVDSRLTRLKVGGDDHTRIILPNAYNFDVTALDTVETDLLGIHAHSWPFTFYQDSVDNPLDYGYGFKLSKAYGANPPYNNKQKGKRCIAVNSMDCSDDSQLAASFNKIIVINDWLTYIKIANAISSETGTVNLLVSTVGSTILKLINRSPVWITVPFELAKPVNFVSFDYTFQQTAQGLLSVFSMVS